MGSKTLMWALVASRSACSFMSFVRMLERSCNVGRFATDLICIVVTNWRAPSRRGKRRSLIGSRMRAACMPPQRCTTRTQRHATYMHNAHTCTNEWASFASERGCSSVCDVKVYIFLKSVSFLISFIILQVWQNINLKFDLISKAQRNISRPKSRLESKKVKIE